MSLVEFDPPERFVAGTVGPPGQRAFFLQAGAEGRRATLSIEKVQLKVLVERLSELLDDLAPDEVEPGIIDNAPLDPPIEEDFRVTTLALSWDDERTVVVIECHDADPEEVRAEDELPMPVQSVRIVLSPAQAHAFVRRSTGVIGAGRPACPFCGGPLDPEGHICPRANGYKR
ncbi:DUF3090 domain-containing protein [Janibacter sp. G56]|uniref:DUF3090 domain-containing protein n=1 Tax=Janibacter sp. G56 TaxID=3418717 RepID=UPI003D024509